MAIQREFKISPGPAKPRARSLTIDVTNMDEDSIAALRRRVGRRTGAHPPGRMWGFCPMGQLFGGGNGVGRRLSA